MKITIYTVETCKFSAEEKEYLKSKNLPFEEKDVEKDHAALEEMLKIGNNFAGTPVTQIEFDEPAKPDEKTEVKPGEEQKAVEKRTVVLKGFTKEEFEKELFPPPADAAAPGEDKPVDPNAVPGVPVVPVAAVATDPNAQPVDPNAPPVPVAPVAAPADPNVPGAAPNQAPNPLDSILQDLQSKIPPPTLNTPPTDPNAPPAIPTAAPPAPPVPPVPPPVDPNAPAIPTVPDFPQTS